MYFRYFAKKFENRWYIKTDDGQFWTGANWSLDCRDATLFTSELEAILDARFAEFARWIPSEAKVFSVPLKIYGHASNHDLLTAKGVASFLSKALDVEINYDDVGCSPCRQPSLVIATVEWEKIKEEPRAEEQLKISFDDHDI